MTADHISKAGAARLAETIRKYWQSQGRTVKVSIEPAGFDPLLRCVSYNVRSDMVNGWPSK